MWNQALKPPLTFLPEPRQKFQIIQSQWSQLSHCHRRHFWISDPYVQSPLRGDIPCPGKHSRDVNVFGVSLFPSILCSLTHFPFLTPVSRISCNWGGAPVGLVQEGVGRGWGSSSQSHVQLWALAEALPSGSLDIRSPYLNYLLCYLPGFVDVQGDLGVPHKGVQRPSFAEATGNVYIWEH